MIIRKHWKRFTLIVATLFLVSCGSDSESVSADSLNSEQYISSATQKSSSSRRVKSSSSESTDPSSSDVIESSSSSSAEKLKSNEAIPSSGEYPYLLYSDPNVHCKDTTIVYLINDCPVTSTLKEFYTCEEYRDKLSNNKTLFEEELVEMEKDALECDLPDSARSKCVETYGSRTSYVCTNGKIFNYSMLRDGLVYTAVEYVKLFVVDSGVVLNGNVESGDLKSDQVCQIELFVSASLLRTSTKRVAIDSVLAVKGDQISDGQKECLENIDPPMYHYNGGVIGKTKICSGEETVNDFYQEKVDELNDEIIPQIRECLGETEPSI
ncbi:hypothetical protein [Fibrobacter sp.]|uniref:hypothetical protein n=1 Tax=Fibrobacter sp. TaxID=35828 RepID=UPI00388F938D